jgi:hypothetical protein
MLGGVMGWADVLTFLALRLSEAVFQFLFRQSVAPATPKEFYSALKRLLKVNLMLKQE